MDLHRSCCEGEIRCQRLVVGKLEVASDDVLRGFSCKVGLRVGWSDDEGCVWRRRCERAFEG